MSELPQVSVVMAVRDGERWLSEAIDSVLAQTFEDLEFVVIDDGSVDSTPQLLAKYVARDPRIRIVRQEPRGLVPALNRGLAEARASFTARLDADDVAASNRLELQVSYLKNHPDVALVGSWAEKIDARGHGNGQARPATGHNELVRVLAKSNPFLHSSVMFRTSVVRDLGGYRPVFEEAEDYDLWLRISERAKIANIPEPLVRRRPHYGDFSQKKIIRGMFSVRLAKKAAQHRRSIGVDTLSAVNSAPDWWSDAIQNEFYADDARVFRFLELADYAMANSADFSRIDLAGFRQEIPRLNHAERKFAQQAVINLLHRSGRPPNLSRKHLISTLFRLHPSRAFRLIWTELSRSRSGGRSTQPSLDDDSLAKPGSAGKRGSGNAASPP